MNETYEYEPVSEGITFKKVGHFFKVGWLRMIIYVLVACVVTAIVVLPIKSYYKSEQVGSLSIEYIYDGIEKGEDPNGGAIDTDNIISPTVLSHAVAAAGLSDTISNITDLRNAMRVEGVTSKEYDDLIKAAANGDQSAIDRLKTYEMHSTRFNIIISEPKQLGLSNDQTTLLLNKIYAAYCDDFFNKYAQYQLFGNVNYNLSASADTEFLDAYDIYYASISSVYDFLSDLNNASVFRTKLAELELRYNEFYNYVISNNVWRNKELAAAKLDNNKSLLEGKQTSLEAQRTAKENQIKNFAPNTTETNVSGGQSTIVYTYGEEYFKLQDELSALNKELATVQEKLNEIAIRSQKINDEAASEETVNKTVLKLQEIEKLTSEFVDAVKNSISDKDIFISQSVKQVLPVAVTNRTADFNVLLVFGCAVLLGLLVAGIVTAVKISKAKDAAVAVAAEPQANEETEKPTEETKENK